MLDKNKLRHMVKKINTFTLSTAICLITQSLLALPANPSEEPQVPRLTLQIPRIDFSPGRTWCDSADATATGRPFGFNKVRYQKINDDTDGSIWIVGCMTNNSGRPINLNNEIMIQVTAVSPLDLFYSYPDNERPLMGPFGYLLPGQTKLMGPIILGAGGTRTATIYIKRRSSEQSKKSMIVERSDITLMP